MDILLKKLNSDDWKIYRDIRLEALQNDPSAFGGEYAYENKKDRPYWEKILTSEKTVVLGLFFQTKLIAIGKLNYWENEKEYAISAVYTKKEYRGKGFSRQIFNELISIVEKLKEKHVVLIVNTNNQVAIDFYTSLGFETKEVLYNQKMGDGNYYDELYMIKNL